MTTDEARQLAAELESWFTTEDGKKYRGRLLEAFCVLRSQADEIERLKVGIASLVEQVEHKSEVLIERNATIAAVLDLHPMDADTTYWATANESYHRCGCGNRYPCPTVRALTGDGDR